MQHPETRRIPLPCGPALAVAEYGTPDGAPVFFFHGWPSARVQGALLHEAAREVGVRVLAVDRPGVGESTPQANRRLADWPPLLRELAAVLGLERVRVLGISGGGPYALASAWGAPELVQAAAVVCGAPPLSELGPDGLTLAYRILLSAHGRSRGAMRLLFRTLHPLAAARAPDWMMTMLRGAVRGPDKAVLADAALAQLCYDGFRYAWGAHRDGVFEDAEIFTQPWGFDLAQVHNPIRMWHGTEDRNFSYRLTEKVAARLPNCALRIVPDEGHYSLPIRYAREILEDLLGAKTPSSKLQAPNDQAEMV